MSEIEQKEKEVEKFAKEVMTIERRYSTDIRLAHKFLNVKVGETKEEIVSAYRQMVKTHHPDRFALSLGL